MYGLNGCVYGWAGCVYGRGGLSKWISSLVKVVNLNKNEKSIGILLNMMSAHSTDSTVKHANDTQQSNEQI